MWFAASMLLATRGGGSPDLRSVDFPLVQGSLLFQGQRGGGAAARRHSVLFVVLGVEVQKVFLVIFFFVLDWSVRSAVNQYQFLAKKLKSYVVIHSMELYYSKISRSTISHHAQLMHD
jgi:hypothetical protein